MHDARLCLAGCNLCEKAAPEVIQLSQRGLQIDRKRIDEKHIAALEGCCPPLALTVVGTEKSVDEIMDVVRRDIPFYHQSGGGITLSGGEPFMSPDFAKSLFRQCHDEHIHTAVETCLHVPWSYIEPSLPYIRLFLTDLKHVNAQAFKRWTQGSAKRVLQNLRRLAATGKNITLRVPLVTGFNADVVSIQSIVHFAADELGVKDIHFLPYHTLGRHKYVLLNRPYLAPIEPLNDPELFAFARTCSESKGLTMTLGG